MKNILSPDSALMKGFSLMGDIMLLNVLFIVCSLPVLTIGASASALYTVTLRLAEGDDRGILKPFFKAFRCNFRMATGEWLVLLAAILLEYFGISILTQFPDRFPFPVGSVYLLVCLAILLVGSWIFAVQVKFENTLFGCFRDAFLIGMIHPAKSLCIMVLTALFPAIVLFFPQLFLITLLAWLLFGFSGIALLNSKMMNRAFEKVIREKGGSKGTETEQEHTTGGE